MADENTTASGSGQSNGDEPPHKMIRLEELEATVAGLIRKNLEQVGLRANSVNHKTSESKGELGGAQTHGGPGGALCFSLMTQSQG